MSLCCWGGIPSFSSTLSLIRSTFIYTDTSGFNTSNESRTSHLHEILNQISPCLLAQCQSLFLFRSESETQFYNDHITNRCGFWIFRMMQTKTVMVCVFIWFPFVSCWICHETDDRTGRRVLVKLVSYPTTAEAQPLTLLLTSSLILHHRVI